MAKLERKIRGDFYTILHDLSDCATQSISATLEEMSDFSDGDCRCSVRVFERYSWFGSNRVSMNLTLFQRGNGPIFVTVITSGGSQAMFFKVNTVGEEAFLNTVRDYLDKMEDKNEKL